jgi:acetylornithine aminotransferase/acetylornithine/N-succinyldiaminopimelate aminotransferase
VKKGFEPMTPGFRHIPFNDLDAARKAISPATVAILIEGVQGEGGVTPATPEYLLGLRQLCDEKKLLLLMDGVQCGHYRTGRFQSFQRILENVGQASRLSQTSDSKNGDRRDACPTDFLPDGLSMAKSLGGGFPIGAFWVRAPFADLLGPGTHATTFGGTPLACAVALKIFEVIERERLDENARKLGDWLKSELERLVKNYPGVLKNARGLGFMLGLEFVEKEKIPALAASDKPASIQMTNRLQQAGVLVIPAGTQVIRLLPSLNLKPQEAGEGIAKIEEIVKSLA